MKERNKKKYQTAKKRKQRSDEDSDSEEYDFKIIEKNIYCERDRIKLPDEEVPVCDCFRIPGVPACDDNCINKLIFIECLQGYCPCGEDCTNQKFENQQYIEVDRFKTPKKGYGLRTLEDIKAGQFVVEYIGEVISNEECRERMKTYQYENNFYFLTLDSTECIDARMKGNLARYINHSCKPNCQTQKWNVAGEIRVGIFALVDISAGTELTFDYQFERFGAKKQICYCGQDNCRGSLGAKPKQLKIAKQVTEKPKEEPKLGAYGCAYVDHSELIEQMVEDSIRIQFLPNTPKRPRVRSPPIPTRKPFLLRNLKPVLFSRLWDWTTFRDEYMDL